MQVDAALLKRLSDYPFLVATWVAKNVPLARRMASARLSASQAQYLGRKKSPEFLVG